MQIQKGSDYLRLNLYSLQGNKAKPSLKAGYIPELAHPAKVELGTIATARQLPDDTIKHTPAQFFFSTEVNATLDRVLNGKAQEVKEAVNHIFESNFFNNTQDYTEDARSELIEMGITKAKFIAETYMKDKDASEFLDTIYLLAAVSKTRKVDPATGSVTYIELPQKPQGAPDNYINPSKLMEQYDPEAFRKFQAAETNPTEKASLLIQFVKKQRFHPEWRTTYLKEQDSIMQKLKHTAIHNRFEGVDARSLSQFEVQVNERIVELPFANKDILKSNLTSFIKLLSNKNNAHS
ncbi:hypothetical protein J31TS6_46100 [Brevibacillus reuszeri]|uniref:hypothetical protein n=1 Tax=Brevibacillus reuszeri TaxID=54915 RepID=UPI001B100768|nr:hypothetical protein [Brevibacillus reuszeri]GIO08582.1 hypothetical protein J31TS6_46100 [Brevibacillus reuszeri]